MISGKKAIFVAEVILKTRGLLVLPLVTKYLGTLEYGLWTQLYVLINAALPLVLAGMDACAIRFIPGTQEMDQKRNFSTIVLSVATAGVLVSAILYFARVPLVRLFFGDETRVFAFVPLIMWSLMLHALLNIARQWYKIQNHVLVFSFSTVAQAVAGVLALILVLVTGKGIYEFLIYTLCADTLLVVALSLRIALLGGFGGPDVGAIPRFLAFGIPLVPGAYAVWGLNAMDRLFLIRYVTLEAVGLYAVVYTIGHVFVPLVARPLRATYPSLSAAAFNKGDLEQVRKLFQYSSARLFGILMPIAVSLIVLARPVVLIISTPAVARVSHVVPLVTLAYLCSRLSSYYEHAMVLKLHQYLATGSIMLALVVNFVLNAFLIPKYHVTGAATATLAAFLAELGFSFAIANRYGLVPTSARFVLLTILSATVMLAVLYAVESTMPPAVGMPILRVVGLASLGLATYATSLHVCRIVDMRVVLAKVRAASRTMVAH